MNIRRIKAHSIAFTAIFLSLLMIFYLVPVSVYASVFEDIGAEKITDAPSQTPLGVFEAVERREENVKHFRLDDGTYLAAQYDFPIHTLDENGEWADIDNSLSASGDEYKTSNARLKFAKKITGNENLFTLHDGNFKITMSLDGAVKKTVGVAVNTETEFDESDDVLKKMTTLDKLSSRIVYADILDGVDLEYIAISNNVKENIIVKERKDSYSYTFTLKLNNLSAAISENGDVLISNADNGETVYVIPAPVVFDANGEYAPTNAARYTLEVIGQNTYALTVTADSEWMNAPGRALPITVDPTIYHGGYSMGQMCDTYVFEGYPDSIYGSLQQMLVGFGSSAAEFRSYVAMRSLPTLPAGSVVNKAELNMTVSSTSDALDIHPLLVVAKKITRTDSPYLWTEGATSFNTPMTFGDVLDYKWMIITSPNTVCSWDITSAAIDWYTGASPNHGIALMPYDEGNTSSRTVSFHSSDLSRSSPYTPFFMIRYNSNVGVESYYTYQSAGAALAGNGHVNLANGALSFAIGTTSTTDALFPFTPTLVYNSAFAGKSVTSSNFDVPYLYAVASHGFMTNMNQSIVPKTRRTENNEVETYYVYTDGDGTEHAFFKSDETGEENIYYDEDGLLLTLTVNTSSYVLEDSAHNIYTFTKSDTATSYFGVGGYLVSVTDINGNKLNINSTGFGRPVSISMTPNGGNAVTHLELSYNAGGTIQSIVNENTGCAVLLYYSSTPSGEVSTNAYQYLRKIVYAHATAGTTISNWLSCYSDPQNASIVTVDAEVFYEYDSSGRLTDATDDYGKRKLEYTYDTAGRVVSVAEYGIDPDTNALSQGQSLSFAYGNDYTVIRTSGNDDCLNTDDDILSVYSFDAQGRCVSSYSTDTTGNQLYGASYGAYANDNEKTNNSIEKYAVIADVASDYLVNSDFAVISGGIPQYWSATAGVVAIANGEDSLYSPFYNNDMYDTFYNVRITSAYGSTRGITQRVVLDKGTYTLSAAVLRFWDMDVNVTLRAQSSSENHYSNMHFRKEYTPEEDAETSLTFEVTEDGTVFDISIEVTANNASASGDYVEVKQMTLAKSVGISTHNKLNYGSFESSVLDGNDDPYDFDSFWNVTGYASMETSDSSPTSLDGNTLRIVGMGLGEESYVSQTVYQASEAEINDYMENPGAFSMYSKQYRVSGRAWSDDALPSASSTFGIRVKVTYMNPDGSTVDLSQIFTEEQCKVIENPIAEFNSDIDSVQFVSAIVPTVSNLFVKKIEVVCEFNGQTGVAYFDDIAFCYTGTDTSFTDSDYNEDGLLKKTTQGYNTTWYKYNEDKNVTHIITRRAITEYVYEDAPNNHRVASVNSYRYVINSDDIKKDYYGYNDTTPKTLYSSTQYEYNAYGQVVSTVTTSGANRLETSTTFNTTPGSVFFGVTTTQTDETGETTSYYYDPDYGYLKAVVYPDGNGIAYNYDAMGRMVSATPATATSTSYEGVNNAESVSYTYSEDTGLLAAINTATTAYSFTYDIFGNPETVGAGTNTLVTKEYADNNGKLERIIYGNGYEVSYTYDALDRVSEVWYSEDGEQPTLAYEYSYDTNGNLSRFRDHIAGKITTYRYDTNGHLAEYYVNDDDNELSQSAIINFYDDEGRAVSSIYARDYKIGSNTDVIRINSSVGYAADGRLSGISHGRLPNGVMFEVEYGYDLLGRTTTTHYSIGNEISYGGYTASYSYYENELGNTSLRVSSVVNNYTSSAIADETYSYTYDEVGNITSISINGVLKYSYEYDDLGQLTRENDANKGQTCVYVYDNAGNITLRKVYAYTTAEIVTGEPTYTTVYGYTDSSWGDKLTSYDGRAITYDEIGNPLSYYNGVEYILEWTAGRRLESASFAGNVVSYTYNDEGIRTSKTVGGIVHEYHLAGTQILSEEWNENGIQHLIVYHYDAAGLPIGMTYRNSSYLEGKCDTFIYVKNLQGDIIKVLDVSGNLLVSYSYDAWGNITSTTYSNGGASTAARFNPFRYRGYYYDTDTGFYYLNSRYYDSEIGRFINADIYVSTGQGLLGNNMFAYCGNDPINRIDGNGELWIEVVIAGIIFSIIAEKNMPTKEEHFNRNDNNLVDDYKTIDDVPNDWKISDNSEPNRRKNREIGPSANAHNFTSPNRSNVKLVSPDGKMEAIFDSSGDFVNTPEDLGTYNYCPFENTISSFIGHYIKDVRPWIKWGNSEDDTTESFDRMFALLGIYWR